MANMTLREAAAACGGTVAQEFENISFFGASADSRRVEKGQLFVALVCARDGHDFAPAAMERGAAAVLGQHPIESLPVVVCEDPLKALAEIAKAWRSRIVAKVVGITGSVGKTTTKEMTAQVLASTCSVHKTKANFNNHIGLPITVLGIPEDCQTAVTEMGMNHFGEISRLTRIAQPDIAVITNIGTMHIENLGTREGILRAKLEILEGLRPGGRVLLNGDEPLLRSAALPVKPLYYGIETDCDLRAVDLQATPEEIRFRAVGMGEDFFVHLPVAGKHHVYDALAAIGVGLLCGVRPAQIAAALEEFQNTGNRQRTFEQNGITVIADCYNAGPESMAAALEVLAARPGRARIAVLGDMLELGHTADAAHTALGMLAAKKADFVFAYGPHAATVAQSARAAGMAPNRANAYPTHEALAEALHAAVEPGDVLLVKGSHGMHMERVVDLLFNTKETT